MNPKKILSQKNLAKKKVLKLENLKKFGEKILPGEIPKAGIYPPPKKIVHCSCPMSQYPCRENAALKNSWLKIVERKFLAQNFKVKNF